MKVLHVLNSAVGGASIGALELMRTSRQAGSGIEHFAVYPGLEERPDPRVASVATAGAVVPMRWWNQKRGLDPVRRTLIWGREMQVTRFGHLTRTRLEELIRDWGIDLVHTNTAAVDAGAAVAAQLGIPHVWHIRERIGRQGFMRFHLSDHGLAKRIGALSRCIVGMSHYAAEIFLENGLAAKTKVVYDGVDCALFDSDDARARGRVLRNDWGIPRHAVLVAKVAAVTSLSKRHDVFIRAAGMVARSHPSVWFAIIGPLPKPGRWTRVQAMDYYEHLRNLVRKERLEDRFLFIDQVRDIPSLMNAIDVLAHACEVEGFGRVAIEAMAAGKPVIGPSEGGFAESVTHGVTGFGTHPRDPSAMASAIGQLVADPELRVGFGEAGRDRARDQFSSAEHLAAMCEVYRVALA